MGIEDVEARLLAMAKDYDPLKSDTVLRTRNFRELNDPFYGAYSQTNRMRAYCEVIVDGVDITHKIDPHLISVRIQDGNQYECDIEIDDRDARLPLPPLMAHVEVRLGWAREKMFKMYEGQIMTLEHGFGRKQGGRRMWVKAQGWNQISTRIKQPMDDNMGAGAPPGQRRGQLHTLPEWIQQIVRRAGGIARVNPAFARFQQDHWGMTGASPMHEITQLGNRFGAMVQWAGGNRLDFMLPAERGLTCRAVWRDNLIGWRVHPFEARTSARGPQTQHFDHRRGEWIRTVLDAATGRRGPAAGATAQSGTPGPDANKTGADATRAGQRDAAVPGHGRIVINGEPAARFDSLVSLEGARAGVDGHYLIFVAEHIYSRQGFVTWLDVQPYSAAQGKANVYDAWPLPRPNPNTSLGQLSEPAPPPAPPTPAQVEQQRQDRLAREQAAREQVAERLRVEDEDFIQQRADNPLEPGRAPDDPGGLWINRPVSALDRRAYRRWYEQRNRPVPPQWLY